MIPSPNSRPTSPTPVRRTKTTHDLTDVERTFLKAMSDLGFGRFESLGAIGGELACPPAAKRVQAIKFGTAEASRTIPPAFELKAEAAEFFASIRSLEHAEIKNLTIRHGLPCSMEIDETLSWE